jgi:hypothetical protein
VQENCSISGGRIDLADWKDVISNPEAMGDLDKKLWSEIEPILNEVLDELQRNGKIETVLTEAEIDRFISTMRKLDGFALAHNALIDLFTQPTSKPFLEATSKFGFDESKVIYMYVASAITVAILSIELFKTMMLFVMKDVDFTVSRFIGTMSSAAPISWPKLKPYIDNDFRNALAHGTYAIINNKVLLFKNAKLLPPDDPEAEMSLDRFMIRVKNTNVLHKCFLSVYVNKLKSGSLTS